VLSCPAGHAPSRQHLADGQVIAVFSSEHCSGCSMSGSGVASRMGNHLSFAASSRVSTRRGPSLRPHYSAFIAHDPIRLLAAPARPWLIALCRPLRSLPARREASRVRRTPFIHVPSLIPRGSPPLLASSSSRRMLPSPDLEGLGLPDVCYEATCGFTHVRPVDSLHPGFDGDLAIRRRRGSYMCRRPFTWRASFLSRGVRRFHGAPRAPDMALPREQA
jgi:hypothetical protein